MTVKDLIDELSKYPSDAEVVREDSEYNGSYWPVSNVKYYDKQSAMFYPTHSVMIK